MHTNKVTRLEIIDHSECYYCKGTGLVNTPTDSAAGQSISFKKECEHCGGSGTPGRKVIMWDKDKEVSVQLQDDDRTLKIFISERVEQHKHDNFCLTYGKCSE